MKRRANNEGSIFKRNNGRWEGQISVTLVNGDRKRKCVTGKSREIVRMKLRELLKQENRGIPYSETDWTVAGYLDYWLRDIHSKDIRDTTLTTYGVMIENHIKPTMGNHKLRELSVLHLRKALDKLEELGRSERTRLECLRVLSVCLNYAMSEEGGELVNRNVAQLVKRPKYTPKKTAIWSSKQTALFLQTAKGHPKYIAFLLVLIYGLRRGEALGLRWCDIDFDNNLIHIRQQIGRINGKLEARDVKTDSSQRILPLMPNARAALLEYAKTNGIEISPFNLHSDFSTNNTVVVSEAGTPLDPQNLVRCFHVLTRKAGLPRIKIHAMRHMAATMLKDLNVPVKDAQLILGHSDVSTTLKFYQHGTQETMCAAISAAEKQIFSLI